VSRGGGVLERRKVPLKNGGFIIELGPTNYKKRIIEQSRRLRVKVIIENLVLRAYPKREINKIPKLRSLKLHHEREDLTLSYWLGKTELLV